MKRFDSSSLHLSPLQVTLVVDLIIPNYSMVLWYIMKVTAVINSTAVSCAYTASVNYSDSSEEQ